MTERFSDSFDKLPRKLTESTSMQNIVKIQNNLEEFNGMPNGKRE